MRVCFRVIAWALLAAAMGAQGLPDWVVQLSRIKRHAQENFERIPNYVCRETVTRFAQNPRTHAWATLDTLKFDVAHVDNKELIALPGSSAFEDKDLGSYIASGSLSTGAFSSVAITLFVSDNAHITAHREGVGLLNENPSYDYEVPGFLSHYVIRSATGAATVGVRGTFWVDRTSLDVIRIEEHAVDIPPRIGITDVQTIVDYALTQIGDSQLLLPKAAELVVTQMGGNQNRNQLEFSNCRQYQSESTVHFGDMVEPPPASKKK